MPIHRFHYTNLEVIWDEDTKFAYDVQPWSRTVRGVANTPKATRPIPSSASQGCCFDYAVQVFFSFRCWRYSGKWWQHDLAARPWLPEARSWNLYVKVKILRLTVTLAENESILTPQSKAWRPSILCTTSPIRSTPNQRRGFVVSFCKNIQRRGFISSVTTPTTIAIRYW